MDRLDQLRKELSSMSDVELLEKIREIRRDRRLVKRKSAANKPAGKARGADTAAGKIRTMLKGMTPDQLKILLTQINKTKE